MFGKFKNLFKAILRGFNVISFVGSILVSKKRDNKKSSVVNAYESDKIQPQKEVIPFDNKNIKKINKKIKKKK
jgi:hypothetical protein